MITETKLEPRPIVAAPSDNGAVAPYVRSARRGDAPEIARLVNAWAEQGLTLPRPLGAIERCIGEFVVVEAAARIIGTGALEVHSPGIAEIRSVAVDPKAKGLGAGREVVEFLLEQARALDVDEVTLLTRIPGFFAKFGFREVAPAELPPSFLEEAISARGRTLVGRTIMARLVAGGAV